MTIEKYVTEENILVDLETKTITMEYKQYPLYFVHKKGRIVEEIHNLIIHFHGFIGRPKENFTEVHTHFAHKDFIIVSFNYPGLWEAPGKFIPEEFIKCCTQVVNFIEKKYGDKNLFVFAESFGGPVSLTTIRRILREKGTSKIKAMAFRAPIAGLRNKTAWDNGTFKNVSIEEMLGYIEQSEELRNSIRTEKEEWVPERYYEEFSALKVLTDLEEITEERGKPIPKLVVVGKKDGLVSTEEIVTTYKNHTLIELHDDLPHNDIPDNKFAEIVDRIVDFYLKRGT